MSPSCPSPHVGEDIPSAEGTLELPVLPGSPVPQRRGAGPALGRPHSCLSLLAAGTWNGWCVCVLVQDRRSQGPRRLCTCVHDRQSRPLRHARVTGRDKACDNRVCVHVCTAAGTARAGCLWVFIRVCVCTTGRAGDHNTCVCMHVCMAAGTARDGCSWVSLCVCARATGRAGDHDLCVCVCVYRRQAEPGPVTTLCADTCASVTHTQTWPTVSVRAGKSVTGTAGACDVHARVSDGQRQHPPAGVRVRQAVLACATGGCACATGGAGACRKRAAGPGSRVQRQSGERARARDTGEDCLRRHSPARRARARARVTDGADVSAGDGGAEHASKAAGLGVASLVPRHATSPGGATRHGTGQQPRERERERSQSERSSPAQRFPW